MIYLSEECKASFSIGVTNTGVPADGGPKTRSTRSIEKFDTRYPARQVRGSSQESLILARLAVYYDANVDHRLLEENTYTYI